MQTIKKIVGFFVKMPLRYLIFITLIISSVTYYMNTFIPRPETFSVLLNYIFMQSPKFAITAILDFIAGVFWFALGIKIFIHTIGLKLSEFVYYNYNQPRNSISKKNMLLLVILGFVSIGMSLFFIGYLFRLFFTIIFLSILALIIMYAISRR